MKFHDLLRVALEVDDTQKCGLIAMRLNMKHEMEYARWRGTVQLSLGIGVRHPDGGRSGFCLW